ncbi:hypothetical protein M409DRAFT_19579 [Zasmidium cellare ATCC 36951]|uniref:Core Histone H2A/H2B/H3 domain-containing protein n=1 Tax=Zasmidium cellare ATCC 36951 TaxID=1080233 RepID=A0A6A6CS30_ZASCE|nr:uncharacterized protein M409DRAFT_19579 [Zasmidium cellare ATCC 36951]KAF2169964.1 hypothetical protein M409DRAFT_19579 [Zasmidium cellare ATCC 36951]
MARTQQTARKTTPRHAPYNLVMSKTTPNATSAPSPLKTDTDAAEKRPQVLQVTTTPDVNSDSINDNSYQPHNDSLIIKKGAFRSIVQEILKKHNVELQFPEASLDAMQAFMEGYITGVMQQAKGVALREGRSVVTGGDVRVARAFARGAAGGDECEGVADDLSVESPSRTK